MNTKEKPTEKKNNDQGTFTKFPNIIFDECDLPETAQIIFMRLCRHVCHRNNVFVGSIRKLSKLVRISKSTIERMLPRLEDARYIKKEWDDDHKQMVIQVLMAPLWEQNKSRTEPTPDLGPHNSIVVPIWDTREINYLNYDAFVPEWDDLMEAVNNPVPKRDKFVPIWDKSGSNWDKFVPPLSSKNGTTTVTTITTETTRENAHVSDDTHATLSSSSNSPSSLQESVASETPSQPLTEATAPLTPPSSGIVSEMPEIEAQREKEASEQANGASHSQSNKGQDASGPEFANDDEHKMWDWLSERERPFYARMNTQERTIYAQWCSLFKKSRPALGDAMFNACRTLGSSDYSRETLDEIKKWCFANDNKTEKFPKGYYHTRGVKLWDIAEKAPDWESVQEQAQQDSLRQTTQMGTAFAEAGVKPGMRLEDGKLVIDSNKTVSGLNYFNVPSKPTVQRGA